METITPEILISAYCQGMFPMAHPDEKNAIYWYDPDPRTIIPLDKFHVSRSLKRTIRKGEFEVQVNTSFEDVMRGCADPELGRENSWISEEIIALYASLHTHGYAHSVETWQHGELVGGVYGVSVGGLFAGESMFSRVTDASKVALAALVNILQEGGFKLFDVQFTTGHLKRFGAVEISRRAYKQRLTRALNIQTSFPSPTIFQNL